MIHGLKLKIKSLREDLAEIETEINETKIELRKGRKRLGNYEYQRLNRLTEQLLNDKRKLKNKKSSCKNQIRKIKSKKLKKKK